MKVKELINNLENYPGDWDVVITPTGCGQGCGGIVASVDSDEFMGYKDSVYLYGA